MSGKGLSELVPHDDGEHRVEAASLPVSDVCPKTKMLM